MSDQFDLKTQEETTTEGIERETQAGSSRLPLPEARTVEVRNRDSRPRTFKKSLPREDFASPAETLVMALFGMTFTVQAVKLPTRTMKNTIWIHDHLLVNTLVSGPDRRNIPLL